MLPGSLEAEGAAAKVEDAAVADAFTEGGGDAVVEVPTVLGGDDDACLAQRAQVLGDIVLGGFESGSEFLDGVFFPEKETNDVQPSGVGESFE